MRIASWVIVAGSQRQYTKQLNLQLNITHPSTHRSVVRVLTMMIHWTLSPPTWYWPWPPLFLIPAPVTSPCSYHLRRGELPQEEQEPSLQPRGQHPSLLSMATRYSMFRWDMIRIVTIPPYKTWNVFSEMQNIFHQLTVEWEDKLFYLFILLVNNFSLKLLLKENIVRVDLLVPQ